jgi:predicted transcriptional regulator
MDIVTLSGVRKELLLYLDGGPRSLAEIREQFDITSPEVSPRIKELLEHRLVRFEDKKYHLTPMGKTIIHSFRPFVDTINVFDQYSDFWVQHDLTSIPEELMMRIGEVKNFIVIEDDVNDLDRTWLELSNVIKISKSIVGVSCAFDQTFPELCNASVKSGIPVELVITDNILKILKKEHAKQMEEFISHPLGALYLTKENVKVSHAVTDNCLFFSLSFANGKFDVGTNLVSNDPSSIKWGRDLFDYYRARSVKIGDKNKF